MAGDEKPGDGDVADAAANAVGVEDGLAEELLAAADFDDSGGVGWAGGGDEGGAAFEFYLVAIEEIDFTVVVAGKQVVENLFALGAERGVMGVELGPHFTVLFGGAGQAANASGLLDGIERREVAQLHRQTACRTAHLCRDGDDERVGPVEFPERQLAIEIQRDEEMFPGPFHARRFGHGGRIPGVGGGGNSIQEVRKNARVKSKG